MQVSTETLLTDLSRLEESLGRTPTANDVIRDSDHSVNTYYKRFGHQWSAVVRSYEDWKESGELPPEPEPFDWRSLHGNESTHIR
ncbi:homing endonuclease associated repeat-containing protein [Halomarina salina]|uniref:Homing endonuclease associated repeat-containing protein n=1 Tax=Halomarina salina TaxID=1872699 RepID=A0ABD5RH77_9EURY